MPGTVYRDHAKNPNVARLFALVMACPVKQDNPSGCPLHNIRQLPVKERLIWVNSRTHEETLDILEHHSTCLRPTQFMVRGVVA